MKYAQYFLNHSAVLGIIVGLGLLGVGFFNLASEDFSRIHHRFPRQSFNLPLASLPVTSTQNSTQIVDQVIRTTGCRRPLNLKAGQVNYIQIQSSGSPRRFLLYLPPNFNNTKPHPLLIGFHGYDSTPWSLEKYTGFDAVANSYHLILVYPEGSMALGGVRGWNTGLHPTIRANDILFVSNLLNSLQGNLCISQNQIYAWGFSNGGGFTAELACKMSNRIAAFAPVSGSYLTAFNSCQASRAVPIIEFHGNADKIVPYLGLSNLKEMSAYLWVSGWAKRNGCLDKPDELSESKRITKYTWTGCKDAASVVHYKIIGGRHDWPHVLFTQTVNNHTNYVDTAHLIWNFFDDHPLRQT